MLLLDKHNHNDIFKHCITIFKHCIVIILVFCFLFPVYFYFMGQPLDTTNNFALFSINTTIFC